MDNVILDVVLGLVLAYAVLALLVMSVQEALAGSLLKSRVTDLHELLKEATGHDEELRQRILENPLVFSLSKGNKVAKQHLLRSQGPSEIPPDIFTRALLMEVDPAEAGKPPGERFATPQDFVDDLQKKGAQRRIVRTLRSLLPGREASWPDFEVAVAAWFDHIGDRAKGWYKRRSARTTFLLAFALAALFNVDTFYMASALAGDPEVRSGVAKLAERVSAEREATAGESGKVGAAAKQAPILGPEARVSARLVDAYNRLRPLYFQDADIAGFGHRLAPIEKTCVGLLDGSSKPGNAQRAAAARKPTPEPDPNRRDQVVRKFASDSDTWIDVLPALQTQIELLLAGSENLLPVLEEKKPSPPATAGKFAANAEPAASAAPVLSLADTTSLRLRHAHGCLTHVSAWMRAATTASKDGATQRAMAEAAVALEDAKAALLELMRERSASLSVKNLFRSAPEAFGECLQSESSLAGLRRCTESRLDTTARLPIGHSTYNRLRQFCVVQEKPVGRKGGWLGQCDAETEGESSVPANALLGTPAMTLTSAGIGRYVQWLAGILVTTMFVMLGAPFWFDLLAKVVTIRAAGRRADQAEAAAKGAGTLPLLQPAAPAGTAASAATPTTPASPVFSSGEVPLTRREIVALQQRIDVVPATGEMDAKTRLKLRDAQDRLGLGNTDRITAAGYLALVGRAPVGDAALVVGTIGRPVLRQPFTAAQALAQHLGQRLDLTPAQLSALVPSTVGDFNDDLRALAVLYRYKTDPVPGRGAKVFSLATSNPAALDQIDELLLNDLLSPTTNPPLPRHAAPWLDWAIGELGQVEAGANNRKASNPRVCVYLDSVRQSLGDAGDKTPWCAAFVNWVVKRHLSIGAPAGAANLSVAAPAHSAVALDWATWGTPGSAAAPSVGDIVVVQSAQSASGFHVGFCLEATATHVYVLGGNQTGGSRVSVSQFPLPVHAARH